MTSASGASSCFCIIQCLQSRSFPLPAISQLGQPLLLARFPLQSQETPIPQPCRHQARHHLAQANHKVRDGRGPQERSWAFRIWSTLGLQAAAFWNHFDRRHVALAVKAAHQFLHSRQVPPRRKPPQDSRTTPVTGSPAILRLMIPSLLLLRLELQRTIYPHSPMKTGP